MFRRLADRVSSVVASVAGSSENTSTNNTEVGLLSLLTSMGFDVHSAQHALQISGGNVEQAAEWLLTSGPVGGAPRGTSVTATAAQTQTEDAELQRAICASLEDASPGRTGSGTGITGSGSTYATGRPSRRATSTRTRTRSAQSAAAQRAGQAALSRLDRAQNRKNQSLSHNQAATKTTTSARAIAIAAPIQSHPNVRLPKRLSQHDTENVILRCANRVAPNAQAVDTLLKALKQLQADPDNLKYRTIDTSTPGFQRSLDAPGVAPFLNSMGYRDSCNDKNILELSFVDQATLYLGISALEQIQITSVEYQKASVELVFDKEINRIIALADHDLEEALRRSQFMAKLPSEPTSGGGIITIELGSSIKIKRKFDGMLMLGSY